MIIYNVTIKVEPAIADEWLQWISEEHIPEMIKTGCFIKATLLKLIEVDDTDGPTYTIQFQAPDKTQYDHYIDTYAKDMRDKSFKNGAVNS